MELHFNFSISSRSPPPIRGTYRIARELLSCQPGIDECTASRHTGTRMPGRENMPVVKTDKAWTKPDKPLQQLAYWVCGLKDCCGLCFRKCTHCTPHCLFSLPHLVFVLIWNLVFTQESVGSVAACRGAAAVRSASGLFDDFCSIQHDD